MAADPPGAERPSRALLLSAFVIATCGLIYELVAGAMASYLLGDSVTQFSLVIGTYLSAMGLGSYLSRYLDRGLLARFVEVELAVALIGGLEAPVLFGLFVWSPAFRWLLYLQIGLIGALVGLELPLLIRILERETSLKELVARVLFLDYIGALAASLVFPLVMLPRLGLFRTSIAFGLINAGVALWTTYLFQAAPAVLRRLRWMSAGVIIILLSVFVAAGPIEARLDANLFADPVVYRAASPYQKIVLTHRDGDTRLFINGALQFSTLDEHRYHESLVHPAMTAVEAPARVLVLGGGDGMAVREVLRYDSVQHVTLVDLDPMITSIFTDRPELSALNRASLSDPRVRVINADAFTYLEGRAAPAPGAQSPSDDVYDVVLVDFPDPNNHGLGKLYTTTFFSMLDRAVAEGGVVAVQATSPMWSPSAFWCIHRTMRHAGWQTRPYHAYVPAFGEWGFVLAGRSSPVRFGPLPEGLRFLDATTRDLLFHFPPDLAERPGPINRLDNQALVQLYEEDWRAMLKR